MTKRLMVISFDAMGSRDLPFMRSLPNFGRFMEKAALCENVKSVYPSLTYPAHTSIITGRKPANHGIINNTRLQPERFLSPDWFWQRKFIKGTTLYDEARKAGWKTAALLWPVTARSRIPYNVPEVLANRPWQNQITVSAVNSSLFYLLDLNRRFGKLRDGIRQPALDNFVHAAALHTIETRNPDLFLLHLTDLDTNRHIYGLDHPKCREAMQRHDRRLGEILTALERTGEMQDTTVILLGDHCQRNTGRVSFPNYFLREKGFLQVKGEKLLGYSCIAKNCDGSCYLYLHPDRQKDSKLKQDIRDLMEEMKAGDCGVGRIITSEEAAAMGADPSCFMMLEAADGWYFLDEWETASAVVNEVKRHKMRATHGYLPEGSEYATFFAAAGSGIRAGARVREMALWDEGPTMAALIGVDLGKTDGRAVEEMLERV